MLMPRRPLLTLLLAPLAALGLALPALLWLALEDAPRLPPGQPVAVADIDRALRLLQRHDPRGKLPGILRSVTLSQRDLELLILQGARRFGEARASVGLQSGQARLTLSLPLPANPFGRWLNLDATLLDAGALPTVQRLTLGRLPVPAWLADGLLPQLPALLDLRSQGRLVGHLVSAVDFGNGTLALAYAWPAHPEHDLAVGLLAPEDKARLDVYTAQLAGLGRTLAATGPVSLSRLLPPVFALAQQRSTDSASAVRENRAALTALAFLVNDAALPPGDLPAPQRPLAVTLLGRRDTPQHFLVSALLSARGGSALADAVGLSKEVADARGGSGFSFNDLAADRAGTRFGLLAVSDPLRLQARLAAGVQEAELMPPVADLPEALSARQLQQRFGGVGAPAYRQLVDDIEARLDGLHLLPPPPAPP